MGLKSDLEEIREKCGSAVSVLAYRKRNSVDIFESADLSLPITPAMKEEWLDRVRALVARVKELAARLPDSIGDDDV